MKLGWVVQFRWADTPYLKAGITINSFAKSAKVRKIGRKAVSRKARSVLCKVRSVTVGLKFFRIQMRYGEP